MNKEMKVDKRIVARSFSRGKSTYDENAIIQQRVSRRLVEKLKGYPRLSTDKILEIGCCTGLLTQMLLEGCRVKQLFLNDLIPPFYQDVKKRLESSGNNANVEIIPMFGDIEQLELPANLDLVVSSATFQWLTDLDSLFKRVAKALKSGSYFVFSIFGPGTLQEFRDLTGIGLEYASVGSILDMLDREFHIEEEETVKDQLYFSSSREILRHLQETGVSGVQDFRWTPKKLRKFEQDYAEKFGGTSGIPVTYISSYVIASKKA